MNLSLNPFRFGAVLHRSQNNLFYYISTDAAWAHLAATPHQRSSNLIVYDGLQAERSV
jgi:hypothetical protein